MNIKHFWLALASSALICSCKTKATEQDSTVAPALSAEPVAAIDPPKPKEPELAEQIVAAKTLAEVLPLLTPHMKDTSERDNLNPVVPALSAWLGANGKWSELMAMPDSKRAVIMKDPQGNRGVRLCAQGSVVEIHTDRSMGSPMFRGGLITASYDVVRFVAVRSSGELVENSPARICGIVTGIQSYGNVRGGTTHAVHLVGMFDLPENKDKPAAP